MQVKKRAGADVDPHILALESQIDNPVEEVDSSNETGQVQYSDGLFDYPTLVNHIEFIQTSNPGLELAGMIAVKTTEWVRLQYTR